MRLAGWVYTSSSSLTLKAKGSQLANLVRALSSIVEGADGLGRNSLTGVN